MFFQRPALSFVTQDAGRKGAEVAAVEISLKLQKPRGQPLGAPPQASPLSELSELLLDEAPSRDIHEGPASYSLISQLLTPYR